MGARPSEWHEYEEEAAAFFRDLGIDAVVDADVTGARAKHRIDVWLAFEVHGLEQRWIVECKAWKSNIPKESVATLLSVCSDVGANQAFLLCEGGFQPAAVALAQQTNVVLTSLRDLRERAASALLRIGLDRLGGRVYELEAALSRLSRADRKGPGFSSAQFKPGLDTAQYFWWRANLGTVKQGIEAARQGASQPAYGWDRTTDKRVRAADPADFVARANETLDGVERWADEENARKVQW